jgi:hypothetical protein
VSPRLAYAIDRALAKDPRDRWDSMAAFCDELEACIVELEQDRRDTGRTMVVPPQRPPRGARKARASHRRAVWPWWLLALVLVAAAAAASGYYAFGGSSGGKDGTTGSSGGGPVRLAGVGAYDPFGTDGEHDKEAPLAVDGDAATRWTTQRYNTPGDLGKDGVGLVLSTPSAVQLARVRVSTDTPGFQAKIQVGDSPTGPFRDASAIRPVNGVTNFLIRDGVKGRYVVVWLTTLPPGQSSAHVNEVQAVAR